MNKLRKNSGFTLMELIAVIAIVAVVCGIGIPTIINSKNSLDKQQEYNYAKSIYLAAQDNLSTMKINGSILQLSISKPEKDGGFNSVYEKTGAGDNEVYSVLDGVAALFTDEYAVLTDELAENDAKHEYCYVKDTETSNFVKIVPRTSIDSSIFDGTHNVTVVFNIVTGDVLFVQYGENGKYSGRVVNSEDKILSEKQSAKVEVINDSECYVKISVPTPDEYKNGDDLINFLNAVIFNIRVEDADDSDRYFSYSVSGKDNNPDLELLPSVDTCVAKWTLDSLWSGHTFADKNGYSEDKSVDPILPGRDVKVTVSFGFNDEDYKTDIDEAEGTGNPLFNNITESDDSSVISVTNGRNLQNLGRIAPDAAAGLVEKSKESGKTVKVSVDSNISWTDIAQFYSKKTGEVPVFKSLAADGLFVRGSKIAVEGNNKTIFTLNIQAMKEEDPNITDPNNEAHTDDNAGLFQDLYVNVSDLNFSDPIIFGKDNVGSLAGAAHNVTIKNCKVEIATDSKNITKKVLTGDEPVNLSSTVFGVTYVGSYGGAIDNAIYASAGLLVGEADNCTVKNCAVDMHEFFIPASSDNFGLLVGSSKNSTIKDCSVNGKIKGGQANITGGIAGRVENGTVSDISVQTDFENIVCYCFGGAVGAVYGGTVKNITCKGDIKISSADPLGKYDIPAEYGAYACPASTGYAGKFVGYIDSGSFKNDTAYFTASGSFGTMNYANMQFVGVVKCTRQIEKITDGLLQNEQKYDTNPKIPVNSISVSRYEAKSDNSMVFVSKTDPINYLYSDISLDGCKYKDASKKDKQQLIGSNEIFYYKLINDGMTLDEAKQTTPMQGGKRYLIMKSDGKGDYDMVICEKVVISKNELQSRWNNGEFYIEHCGNNTGVVMYDTKSDAQKNNNNYYFSTKDNSYYKPYGTDYDDEDYFVGNHKDKIDAKYDVYKYNVKVIKLKKDLGIDYGQITDEQYNELMKYSWYWQAHEANGTRGNLIFNGKGWNDAYLYLNCDDVYLDSQNIMLVIPYSDEIAKWYDMGSCRSTKSGFYLNCENINGELLVYRTKEVSITEQKASFAFDENGTDVDYDTDLSKLSKFSSGIFFAETNEMTPQYSVDYDSSFKTYFITSQ